MLSSRLAKLIALVMVFSWVACDGTSDDNGNNDIDRFVGSWTLSAVTDDDGDQIAGFAAAYRSFIATFATTGRTVTILLDTIDDNVPDIDLMGTYAVDEGSKTLTVTVDVDPVGPVPIQFTYDFANDNQVALSASAIVINTAFGTNLTGTAVITVTRSQVQ